MGYVVLKFGWHTTGPKKINLNQMNSKKSITAKKNSKNIKNTKKRAGGSSGVSSSIQARSQRQGGRIPKTQKASSCRIGTDINRPFTRKNFSNYALKSCSSGQITLTQLRAIGTYLKRNIKKRSGRILRRVFPYVPMTKKPSEVRMGKGKGSKVDREVYPVRPGKTIFELSRIGRKLAMNCLQVAALKLSVKSRIVKLKE